MNARLHATFARDWLHVIWNSFAWWNSNDREHSFAWWHEHVDDKKIASTIMKNMKTKTTKFRQRSFDMIAHKNWMHWNDCITSHSNCKTSTTWNRSLTKIVKNRSLTWIAWIFQLHEIDCEQWSHDTKKQIWNVAWNQLRANIA